MEDKNIADYFLHVDEIVNALRGLTEPMENKAIVLKVIKSLLMRFDFKVSILEEISYLAMLNG